MWAAPSRSGCAETPRFAAIPSQGSPNKACIYPRAARSPLPLHRASAPRAARALVLLLPPLHALHSRSLMHLRVFSSNWSCSTTIPSEERAGRGGCAFTPLRRRSAVIIGPGALLQGCVYAAICMTPRPAETPCPTPRLSTILATGQAIPPGARPAPRGPALRPCAPSPARHVRIPPVTARQKCVCPGSSPHTRIARAPTYPRLPTCF
jgi:hypothetical protein